MNTVQKAQLLQKRKWRIRKKVTGTAARPRLSVKFSSKHIYAQVINDDTGTTLLAVSTVDKQIRGEVKYGGNKAAAVLTLLGDGAKGWLAVFLARHFMLPDATIGLIALAVFFGHLFPVFLRFKGGKGVATAAGVLLALDWVLGVATLGIWLLTVFGSRYSSLGALFAAVGAPLLAAMMWGGNFLMLAVGVMSLALIAKHWGNLQRLLAGQEPKVGTKKKG